MQYLLFKACDLAFKEELILYLELTICLVILEYIKLSLQIKSSNTDGRVMYPLNLYLMLYSVPV